MKLKSCLLLTLMVCAMFACSDSDDPAVEQPKTPVVADATMAMSVQTKDRVITKATKAITAAEWSKGDDVIKTLTVVVFNAGAYDGNGYNTGDVVASYSGSVIQGNDGIATLSGEGLLSGAVEMLLIANLEPEAVSTISGYVTQNKGTGHYNKSDVLEVTTKLANEVNYKQTGDKGLTMSEQISVTLQPGDNYIGWNDSKQVTVKSTDTDLKGIELVRTVAYINLTKVTLQLPEEYKAARFYVDSVFVANAKDISYIDENGNGYCEALTNPTYSIGSDWKDATGTYKTASATLLERLGVKIQYPLDYQDQNYQGKMPRLEVVGKNPTNSLDDLAKYGNNPFYVYENWKANDNYTLLIVKGDYYYSYDEDALKDHEYGEGNLWTPVLNRYYTIIVNDKNFRSKGDVDPGYEHIKRNTKYNVSLTIAGTGSPDPFTPGAFAHVAAQVEVAAWNVIEIEQPVD